MALLTKSIGIITPLILSIIVVVAPRLISYSNKSLDRIVQETKARSYCTWASGNGREKRKVNEAVQCICVIKMKSERNTHKGAQESDVYPTAHNFSRGANGYTMPGMQEVAWWGQ